MTFALGTGDCFVFCTDGVFEAMNAAGEEFGSARLIEVIGGARGLAAREIVDRIFAAVEAFRGRRAAERRHDGGGGQDYRL